MTPAYAAPAWAGFATAVAVATATLTGSSAPGSWSALACWPSTPRRAGHLGRPGAAGCSAGSSPAITSCVCLVVAGLSLLARAGGGLYWLLQAALVAILAGLTNAWVLLVEILR